MTGRRRTRASVASKTARKEVQPVAKEGSSEEPVVVPDEFDFESEVAKLRGRWELASVLNFLSVFEPVIGSDLRLSAEQIEMGLIKPDSSLAQLHIALLKGIPPVSKTLDGSDAWVVAVCKKLAVWWAWVAEGETPLMAAKGEEMSRYESLDPTNRLLVLKALCEIRADQDDTLSFINDAIKQGNQISCFRKDKIGADGNGTTYWYDGNKIIGHRLYREVIMYQPKRNSKSKQRFSSSMTTSRWETLATNLEEFNKAADELSCSKVVAEVDVAKIIKTDAIPVLEKLMKNKERALKRKQRQEMVLNNIWNPHGAGITRSCRTRRTISYTFEEYDQAIDEALQLTKEGHPTTEQKREGEGSQCDGGRETDTHLQDDSGREGASIDSNTESHVLQEVVVDYENKDNDYRRKMDDDSDDRRNLENSEAHNRSHASLHSQKANDFGGLDHQKLGEEPWSKGLAGATSHLVNKTGSVGTKNRLRQRPTRNSALDSLVVPDSEDEGVPKSVNQEMQLDASQGTRAEVGRS